MLQTIRNALAELRDLADWAPDAVVGVVILLVAALIALIVHLTALKLLHRLLRDRHPYLRTLLTATAAQTRLALLVAALFIALPVTPFSAETRTVIAEILLLAAIALIGWALITTVNMVADLYLLRFRLDVADNLEARKHVTQIRVLARTVNTVFVIATIGAALMTFEPVRQYGVSLFASAGVAGLIAGLAARPVLSNLFAGIQIAMTQPIRINDSVFVENEFGQVEEITSTYVVLKLWDLRRMIVPLSYFIEKPFQNWTREFGNLIGAVLIYVDFMTPIEPIRKKALEIISASPFWDEQVAKVHVTNVTENTVELRVIASARSAGDAFELRCEIREKLVVFLQQDLPAALPRMRQSTVLVPDHNGSAEPQT
jgi:small-conductance mechanosensitive channel